MKRYLLPVMVLFPLHAGSGEYSRTVTPHAIVENRAGEVRSYERSRISRRLEAFAVKHGCPIGDAALLAELLAACEHPRIMAAIAARESGFDVTARGAAGEVGMYQVIPADWGYPGDDAASQTRKTETILDELLVRSRGSLQEAVRRYNGSGPDAREYARSVMRLAREV